MIASIGTPLGFSKSGAMFGTLASVVVNRLLGCAQGDSSAPSGRSATAWPVQSRQPSRSAGGSLVLPSHQTSPVCSLYATLVKIVPVPSAMASTAVGLVAMLVSLATPKTPFSGLIA